MNFSEGRVPDIPNPRLWRLLLQIDAHSLRAVGMSTVDDGSLFHFSVPLAPEVSGPLAALEEAVYAVPGLLADFGRVDVVVRTRNYMAVPAGMGEDARSACAAIARLVEDGETLMTDNVDNAGADILWALSSDTANFLARTFRNPRVMCHVSPLMRYFSRKTYLGNSGKIYAHLVGGADSAVDLISFDAGLRLCCTHSVTGVQDAAYFVLACMRSAGLDPENDEVLLCGDPTMREELTPLLRRFAGYVMPVIFPSAAFRAGRESLNAPFPLVLLPLCE